MYACTCICVYLSCTTCSVNAVLEYNLKPQREVWLILGLNTLLWSLQTHLRNQRSSKHCFTSGLRSVFQPIPPMGRGKFGIGFYSAHLSIFPSGPGIFLNIYGTHKSPFSVLKEVSPLCSSSPFPVSPLCILLLGYPLSFPSFCCFGSSGS